MIACQAKKLPNRTASIIRAAGELDKGNLDLVSIVFSQELFHMILEQAELCPQRARHIDLEHLVLNIVPEVSHTECFFN